MKKEIKTYTKKNIIKELLTMFSGKTFANNKDVNDFFSKAVDVAYTEGYKRAKSLTEDNKDTNPKE